jgi:hypothetical protein
MWSEVDSERNRNAFTRYTPHARRSSIIPTHLPAKHKRADSSPPPTFVFADRAVRAVSLLGGSNKASADRASYCSGADE